MKDIIISDTATGIVSAGKIVNRLNKLDERIELSKSQAKNLFKDLDISSNSIEKTEKKFFGGYKTKDLFDLIIDNHNTDVKTTKIVNNLIKNNKLDIKENNNIITDFKNHTNFYSLGYLLPSKQIIPFSTEKIMHKDIPSKLEIKYITYHDDKGVENNVKFELLSEIIEKF